MALSAVIWSWLPKPLVLTRHCVALLRLSPLLFHAFIFNLLQCICLFHHSCLKVYPLPIHRLAALPESALHQLTCSQPVRHHPYTLMLLPNSIVHLYGVILTFNAHLQGWRAGFGEMGCSQNGHRGLPIDPHQNCGGAKHVQHPPQLSGVDLKGIIMY